MLHSIEFLDCAFLEKESPERHGNSYYQVRWLIIDHYFEIFEISTASENI